MPQDPATGGIICFPPGMEDDFLGWLAKYKIYALFSNDRHAHYFAFLRNPKLAIPPGPESKILHSFKNRAIAKFEIQPPIADSYIYR